MSRSIVLVFSLSALAYASCGDASSSPSTTNNSRPVWLLASEPADAQDILQAKSDAQEGETITLRGIIGGTIKPLSSESPSFRIVDTNLFNKCTESGDDHCKTPWDYCCALPEDLVLNSATVVLVDDQGLPLATDPTTLLQPLDLVTLVGTVAYRPNSDILTVNASGVYRAER
ncbi:MAG: hypothetical protein AAGB34_10410 [Planctomycetota bacterium]